MRRFANEAEVRQVREKVIGEMQDRFDDGRFRQLRGQAQIAAEMANHINRKREQRRQHRRREARKKQGDGDQHYCSCMCGGGQDRYPSDKFDADDDGVEPVAERKREGGGDRYDGHACER